MHNVLVKHIIETTNLTPGGGHYTPASSAKIQLRATSYAWSTLPAHNSFLFSRANLVCSQDTRTASLLLCLRPYREGPAMVAAYPKRVEGRARARERALPGRKAAGYCQPFHEGNGKAGLGGVLLSPAWNKVNGWVSLKPRLVSAGEKDLAWTAEEALAVSVLSPHHTLESVGELFKLNTNLVLTFKRVWLTWLGQKALQWFWRIPRGENHCREEFFLSAMVIHCFIEV